MSKKKIAWESWNQIEYDIINQDNIQEILSSLENEEDEQQIMSSMPPAISSILDIRADIIETPFGPVNSESQLKPSDRWECWLGYTNFDITHSVSNKIKTTQGVEALKVLSRYTFCVGVGKMFEFKNIRRDIENAICK